MGKFSLDDFGSFFVLSVPEEDCSRSFVEFFVEFEYEDLDELIGLLQAERLKIRAKELKEKSDG